MARRQLELRDLGRSARHLSGRLSRLVAVARRRIVSRASIARQFASAAVVYALVTFTWLFFRSHDTATTMAYLSGLAAMRPGFEGALIPVLALWA